EGPLNRLLDPPGGVGAEANALIGVEAFDGAEQADVALLDEIGQRHAATAVVLGDADDKAEVGPDHAFAGADALFFELLAFVKRDLAIAESPGGAGSGRDGVGQVALVLRGQ